MDISIAAGSTSEYNKVNENLNSPADSTNIAVQAEEEQQAQPSSPDVQVDINSNNVPNETEVNASSLDSAEAAQETTSNIVNLFQENPELSVTAQGGQLTAEKADAALKAVS